jgi:hypothetical protein
VVAGVVSADNIGVEFDPARAGGGIGFWLAFGERRREGMAGGAERDERFAGIEITADGVELILRRQAAAGAENEKVGFGKGFDQAGEMVLMCGVFQDNGDDEASRLQFGFGEVGEGFPGVVLILADHEDGVFLERFKCADGKGE